MDATIAKTPSTTVTSKLSWGASTPANLFRRPPPRASTRVLLCCGEPSPSAPAPRSTLSLRSFALPKGPRSQRLPGSDSERGPRGGHFLTTGLGRHHGPSGGNERSASGRGLGAGGLLWHCQAAEGAGAQVEAQVPEDEGVEAAHYLAGLAADEKQRRGRGLPIIPGRLPNFLAPTHVLPGGHPAPEPGEARPGPRRFQEEELWSDIEAEEDLEGLRGPSREESGEGEHWRGESAGRYKHRADALDSVARSCVGH